MVGQTVGKYRVASRLGRGGMGTVYRAVDETLDREVAIKCLNADLGDADLLKRFRAEAIALARLNHPNIATLFELTEYDGQLLMVMEFVRGETFDRVAHREGQMPIARAAQLCAQVLDALDHAHRAGIVHRDLKPANLMLTESGLVKVMDFGLARMAGTEHLTNDGYMVGTPAYMSPEQVLGRDIDGRADVYAMGVVLFRLLTSQLPFKADSGIAMVQRQLNDPPTPVRQLRADLPPACEGILLRALAKMPSERFQTADEFKSALAQLDPAVAATGVTRIASGVLPVPAEPLADEPTLPPTPTPLASATYGVPSATVVLPRDAAASASPSGVTRTSATARLPRTEPVTPGDVARLASVLPPKSAADTPSAVDQIPVTPRAPSRPARSKVAPAAIAAGVVLLAGIPVGGVLVWRSQRGSPPAESAAITPAGPAAVTSSPTAASASPPTPAPPVAGPAAAATTTSTKSSTTSSTLGSPSTKAPATATTAGVPKKSSGPNASAAAPAAPETRRPAFASITFGKLKLLVVDEKKSRDRDASLHLGQNGLDLVDGRETIDSVAYHEVIGVYYSHSKEPRWTTPAGVSAPVAKAGSVFGFLKGSPDWITLRTKQKFIPLRVRDDDVERITTELEARTGAKVVTAK